MKKTENEAQILDHIKSMNLDDISPREAWDILYSMKTTLN